MSGRVQAQVMMSFLASEELSFRIPVELVYEASDPYAVRCAFALPGDEPVHWVFGRELLVDGVSRPAGEGDVRITPVSAESLSDLLIRLQVGDAGALLRVSAPPLVAFLDRTDRIVPLGQEPACADFDAELDRLLAGRL
ncbi:SsgA family sporulation/cell division regulator [Streptomyces sp. TRM 70351]|uniref:SsgA family sporulation/cell division regulator n=1 Tax=Streptomyces sp. TRM 70351 TaxID=3116552 RepID=UPI002E7B2562|nr:SsgA family sporulation/cell division regulator [Streptomyces sp. TRM 70351]MEE1929982.1 SsgA family sporulation/cell division regulator [Streptomyces sp. TRM 70351]